MRRRASHTESGGWRGRACLQRRGLCCRRRCELEWRVRDLFSAVWAWPMLSVPPPGRALPRIYCSEADRKGAHRFGSSVARASSHRRQPWRLVSPAWFRVREVPPTCCKEERVCLFLSSSGNYVILRALLVVWCQYLFSFLGLLRHAPRILKHSGLCPVLTCTHPAGE